VSPEFLRRAARPRLEPATSCGHLSCIQSAVVRESSTKHISLPNGCSSVRTCEFMSVPTTTTMSLFQNYVFLRVMQLSLCSLLAYGQYGHCLWPTWSQPISFVAAMVFSRHNISVILV